MPGVVGDVSVTVDKGQFKVGWPMCERHMQTLIIANVSACLTSRQPVAPDRCDPEYRGPYQAQEGRRVQAVHHPGRASRSNLGIRALDLPSFSMPTLTYLVSFQALEKVEDKLSIELSRSESPSCPDLVSGGSP